LPALEDSTASLQEDEMHTRPQFPFTLMLALAGILVLGHSTDARAQQRGYVFADEPLVSINRSYLGYGNFVDPGPGLPAHADPPGRNSATTRALAPAAPVYVRPPTYYYVPARPRMRWFGWRRGYGY
jgi:hypothetical protein